MAGVEYNVPFLSFVFSYILSASHLRRTLINLPYVIYAIELLPFLVKAECSAPQTTERWGMQQPDTS